MEAVRMTNQMTRKTCRARTRSIRREQARYADRADVDDRRNDNGKNEAFPASVLDGQLKKRQQKKHHYGGDHGARRVAPGLFPFFPAHLRRPLLCRTGL